MCREKIKAYADSNRIGNASCVTPIRAEEILRTFYGLSPRKKREEANSVSDENSTPPPEKNQERKGVSVDLEDFF